MIRLGFSINSSKEIEYPFYDNEVKLISFNNFNSKEKNLIN